MVSCTHSGERIFSISLEICFIFLLSSSINTKSFFNKSIRFFNDKTSLVILSLSSLACFSFTGSPSADIREPLDIRSDDLQQGQLLISIRCSISILDFWRFNILISNSSISTLMSVSDFTYDLNLFWLSISCVWRSFLFSILSIWFLSVDISSSVISIVSFNVFVSCCNSFWSVSISWVNNRSKFFFSSL